MQPPDYEVARQRVMRRVQKWAFFALHVFLYLMVVVVTENVELAAIWLLALITHGLFTFDVFSGMIERMTQREMEQIRQGEASTEKPKRRRPAAEDELGEAGEIDGERLHLTDDGELEISPIQSELRNKNIP